MSFTGWLELHTSRALLLTGILTAAVSLVAWGKALTSGDNPWPAAMVFVLAHALGLVIACLVRLVLNDTEAGRGRTPRPPRILLLLPLLELPVLAVLAIILSVSGHTEGAPWGLAVALPFVSQLLVVVAWALSVWLVVPLVRALARLVSRTRTKGRGGRQATVGALLILTVVGGVMFVAGTMLAGLSPTGPGTRAGLIRQALRTLWTDSGGVRAWAWIGRIGLIVLLLGGAPLVLARRGS